MFLEKLYYVYYLNPVGFNCRNRPIAFVPVIEDDREIIKGKTAHRLLVEAERDNRLNLPKKYVGDLKRGVREEYQQMNKQYQKFCENNDRAYYPWRTQILTSKEDASKIVSEKIAAIDKKYQSIYNDNGTSIIATKFANQKKLDKHIKDHLGDFPKMKPENYEGYARRFLSQPVDGKGVLGFTNKRGFVFRYDRENNMFATAKPSGIIETFYKPKDGLLYWEEQIDKYGKTKN